jgi:hypothetical protein
MVILGLLRQKSYLLLGQTLSMLHMTLTVSQKKYSQDNTKLGLVVLMVGFFVIETGSQHLKVLEIQTKEVNYENISRTIRTGIIS